MINRKKKKKKTREIKQNRGEKKQKSQKFMKKTRKNQKKRQNAVKKSYFVRGKFRKTIFSRSSNFCVSFFSRWKTAKITTKRIIRRLQS